MDATEEQPIRLLLIEDDEGDADLIREYLAEAANNDIHLTWVNRIKSAEEHFIQEQADIVLSDLNLPDSSGMETFRALRKKMPDTPIILITGTFAEEQMAKQMLQAGAQDYLMKGEIDSSRLVRAIRYAIGRHKVGQELKAKIKEVEWMNGMMMDREERILGLKEEIEQLKNEVNVLLKELGREKKYETKDDQQAQL